MQPKLFSRTVTNPSLPISCAQESRLRITLTQSKRRSTTYFSQHYSLKRNPNDLRQLVTLTPSQGGLAVPDLRFEAPQQFAASTSITAPHVDSITTQSMFIGESENPTEELKRQHQALKTASVKSRMY